MSKKLNVLFVCENNSCRSQMAEGWARHLFNETLNPFSAGIEPRPLDPLAVKVMKEVGVDISKQETHAVQDFFINDIDLIVTVCSETVAERCPTFPKKVKIVNHPFENPSDLTRTLVSEAEKLVIYRRIREKIRKFVEELPCLPQAGIKLKGDPAYGTKFRVLFVCEHNSARSQMAEAFLKNLGRDAFEVESGGIEAGIINPLVIEVMHEKGYDLRKKTTQTTFDLLKQGKSYDIVITVCSRKVSEQCPIFPGRALRMNWPFDDPSKIEGDKDTKLKMIRIIRDQIEEKIKDFIQKYNEKGLKMFL